MVRVAGPNLGGGRAGRKNGGARQGSHGDAQKTGLGQLVSDLIHEGHSEAELLNCSLDKLRFFHRKAVARRSRESAARELSFMHAIHTAVAPLVSEKNQEHFDAMERLLQSIVRGEPSPRAGRQKENLKRLSQHLALCGVQASATVLRN